ncbi:transcription factor HES-2-like [Brienomyrus brachyistius]|uniref:transcription factor HES-2-like n=1 Tax=Brienomyrus brachyistius TaxID=42636 RepID=UPI0020B1F589|nr:transcription factor HES-2-like [Brienomyrus brachyistius]
MTRITAATAQNYGSQAAKRKEASELRKTLKPLMEKRRRARINESLEQLKTLILPLFGKDKSRYSKFEKADILEMTVRFLRRLPSTSAKSPSESYKDGYKACRQRISTLLYTTNLLDQDTSQRVNEYLRHSMSTWDAPSCQNCKRRGQNCQGVVQMSTGSLRAASTGAGGSRPDSSGNSNSSIPYVNQHQAMPQAISTNMWRPW